MTALSPPKASEFEMAICGVAARRAGPDDHVEVQRVGSTVVTPAVAGRQG